MATNTTQTFSGNRLIGELERVIEKEKPKENLVPEEDIIFHLPKILTILGNEDFKQKQEMKKQQDDEIKEEIDLTRLKVAVTDMRYFARSKLFRRLVHKKNFSLIWPVVFKLGYLFCQ